MSNLTSKDLYGCMTALITPMHEDGSVDYVAWENLVLWQIKAKTKAIIVAGTTGESAMLTDDEFVKLLKTAVKLCQQSQTRVIAQTGQICANKVIQANKIAHQCQADAVLVVTPYYIRTTQKGLIKHFETIADASNLPIVLYNVPSRTQNDLLAKSTEILSKHNKVIGIKEASSDENRVSELIGLIPRDFAILSGNDDMFLQAMHTGASGIISVASNVRPVMINNICNYMALGDIISAKKCDSGLESLYKMLSCQPNPIPVKFLMQKAGLIEKGIRLPLIWIDGNISGIKPEIEQIIEETKL